VGFIPDIPVRNTLYGIGYVDIRQQALATESIVDTASIDKYRFIRNAYLRARRYQVYDGHPPPEEDEDSTAPTSAATPAPAASPAAPANPPAPAAAEPPPK
jgi:phospholipid-binding lipoprotein MlaA